MKKKIGNTLLGSISKRRASFDVEAGKKEKERDFAEAARLYEEQVKVDPTNESAITGMIKAYQQLRNMPKMKEGVDKLAALSDSYADAHFFKGIHALNTNQAAVAKEAFEKAVDLNVKYSPAYYYLGIIYSREQQNAKAIAALEKYDSNGGNLVQAYELGIQICEQMKNKALSLYFQSKKLYTQKNFQESYNVLQQSLQYDKNYEPAVKLNEAFQKSDEKAINHGFKRIGKWS